MNGKSNNTVIAQSLKLDVSACLVFSIYWNHEVNSNASDGMDLLGRQEQAGKEQNFPISMSLYILLAEGMAQIESGLKIWIKHVFPPQKSGS